MGLGVAKKWEEKRGRVVQSTKLKGFSKMCVLEINEKVKRWTKEAFTKGVFTKQNGGQKSFHLAWGGGISQKRIHRWGPQSRNKQNGFMCKWNIHNNVIFSITFNKIKRL